MIVGPAAIVAGALVVAGLFKLRDPGPTQTMLRTLHLPAASVLVVVIGLAEVTAGIVALVFGGITWAFVAAGYALFTVLMARLVWLGDAATSCGCFGTLSAPPSWLHVATNAVGAAITLTAVVTLTPSLIDAGDGSTLTAAVLGALVALGVWLYVIAMTLLVDLNDAARPADRADSPSSAPAFALVAAPRRIDPDDPPRRTP